MTAVHSTSLAAPSLCHPRMTHGVLAQRLVPQIRSISSLSPLPRAPSGPAGVLHSAMTITASQAPASTSYTCAVDLLSRRALTVVQQLMSRRSKLSCRLPRLHHHTSRHFSHSASPLSNSDRRKSTLSGTVCGLPCQNH